MEAVTAAEMKMIEAKANAAGISYTQMMENAGHGAYLEIIKKYGLKKTAVVVGKGNNGGDGYVVARYLAKEGADVAIVMAEGMPVTEDAKLNYDRCLDMNIDIIGGDSAEAKTAISSAELIVEAVYGSGFHGELRENVLPIFEAVNNSDAPVCALDLPGGINADNGTAAKEAIVADTTLVFHCPKIAHTCESAKKYFGEIILVDIGISDVV